MNYKILLAYSFKAGNNVTSAVVMYLPPKNSDSTTHTQRQPNIK